MLRDVPEASPAVVAAWVAGWALSRGVGAPRSVAGGHYLDVGLPQHLARYVFASIDGDRLRALASSITDPWIYLKVGMPSHALAPLWPQGWAVQDDGFMMTTRLESPASTEPDPLCPGYRLSIEGDAVITVSMVDEAGVRAASGKMAMADGYATFDQIVTDENHRRRGLGRAVMQALTAAAVRRGIGRAVLVATSDGRALYTALGWQFHAHVTTAVIPADASERGPPRSLDDLAGPVRRASVLRCVLPRRHG
jgi:GNAT superfamily N-acetyltransferase